MPSPDEIPLLLRGWQGVDVAMDPAFLGPGVLQAAQNFVPDPLTSLLTKRRGMKRLASVGTGSAGTSPEAALKHIGDPATGDQLLYMIGNSAGTRSVIYSPNEGVTLATNGLFTSTANTNAYGLAVLGGNVYAGNGVDPLLKGAIGSTVGWTSLAALAATNLGGSTTTAVAATAAAPQLDPGSYAYTWAVYNSVTKLWVSRGAPVSVTNNVAGNFLRFGSPLLALGANQTYHLFVAPRNLPLEFAHDQAPEGIAAAANVDVTTVKGAGNLIPVASTVTRTASMLVSHRARLWLAGDTTSSITRSQVTATGVIIPGLEQAMFNQGDFYPANAVINVAVNDGDVITGMAVATDTVAFQVPSATLLIFKNRSTWAFFGDILDDLSADLVQLSAVIGCVGPLTVVNTPLGVIWQGHDNVYLSSPTALKPVAIGDAIVPALRAIPRARRANACAMYHKGFYKLAITPAGATTNTQQWWLDLRRGVGGWWGPHQTQPAKAMAAAVLTTTEDDRGYAILDKTNANAVALDQANQYTDDDGTVGGTASIVSRLKAKSIDAGQPFLRKSFRRLRVNARSVLVASLGVQVAVDGGMAFDEPPIALSGSTGATWDSATWDVSTWDSGAVFHEGESIFNADRPLGSYAELTLTHAEAAALDLRDFELRFLPFPRQVA